MPSISQVPSERFPRLVKADARCEKNETTKETSFSGRRRSKREGVWALVEQVGDSTGSAYSNQVRGFEGRRPFVAYGAIPGLSA